MANLTFEKMIIMTQQFSINTSNIHTNMSDIYPNSSLHGIDATRRDYEERADHTKDAAPNKHNTPNCGRKYFNNNKKHWQYNWFITANHNPRNDTADIVNMKVNHSKTNIDQSEKGFRGRHNENMLIPNPATNFLFELIIIEKFTIFLKEQSYQAEQANTATNKNFKILKLQYQQLILPTADVQQIIAYAHHFFIIVFSPLICEKDFFDCDFKTFYIFGNNGPGILVATITRKKKSFLCMKV